ncbi:MAG: DPP IV N-terminal domain-containing protein [Dysgonamonadaceae bacterium]|jgi:Tol biopolymer transport system component/C-terminal processing protease CtpA/Prc|nr:DPP IV N-terminal domain-containing protein [Dysgonamonadaceae bacterium]
MKAFYSTLLLLLLPLFGFADTPLWMRYPAISPDGKEIAFSYKGDIYKVASTGGEAKQLTMHEAHDYMPVWSPDGKNIAFASDRKGNFDIFLISSNGGGAKRLTTHSGSELPYAFSPDGKYIIYGAKIQAPAASAAFPSGVMSELYKIPVNGGRPEQIIASPAENIYFSKDGNKIIYQDRKGQEDRFRKHHKSSVTRDIWTYDLQTGQYQALITDPGEDTNPVFSPDNKQVYFLSERSGTYNIHVFPFNDPKQVKQISSFKTHPIRFLSIANNETLCYFYDGEIYTQAAGGKAQKVKINITEEGKNNDILALSGRGAYGRAVSPDGKQVAVVMRGEIFVTSVDYKYTKRITNTPAQDNYPSFSPDGKTLVYATERDGLWNLYSAKTGREDDLYFFNATIINEEPLFKPDNIERSLPQFSPDGKEIAFIQDRNKLMVYNLASKKTRQITDGSGNLDSSGSVSYEWSPDGKWFTVSYCPNKHMPYSDIGLVSSQGGTVTNLTNSGYTSSRAHWVMGGNAVLFLSERYGMRNHASWGSLDDAMLVFLNQNTYDKFILSEDDYKLLKEEEKAKEKNKKKEPEKTGKDDKKDDKTADKKEDDKAKDSKAVVVELKGIEDRIIRLTPNSSSMGDAILSPEGDKLFYLASFEKGYDLWQLNTRTKETKIVVKGAGGGSLSLDKDGKNIFMLGATIQKIGVSDAKKTTVTGQTEMEVDLAAERRYMFDHVCMQEEKRFYNKTMHGVDWPLMKKAYSRFLPHINNNYDFGELLSEILGELNVSHTGGRFRPVPQNPDATAQLGVLFSWNYAKDGLLIDEVLEKGPFDNAESKVKAGCVVEMIDGAKILAGEDYFPLLNKKAGKNTLISLYNPVTNERWEEVIKPVSSARFSDMLYNRWVKQREADVDRLSNGRLGYVHIQSMGDPSFRNIYSDILGKYNDKEGIVIDIRFNGGGRLHEDIEILFSGKKYFTQVVRGNETCDMPSRRWNKPSIMVMGEACYSNAHGTPWVYKHTGIGKLVGMPVPGTMTSVSWETLQDPTLVFGIPIVGYELPDGSYLENQQLEPDFKIANSPDKYVKGEDEQLAKAVQELLREL